MNCPICGHGDNRVLRTTSEGEKIVRLRECLGCGKRFRTLEARAELLERANDIVEAFRALKGVVGEE